MKTFKVTVILLTVLAAMQVKAQTSIEPFETTIDYDNDQRPCIQVNLDPEPSTLKNAWKDYLKDNYDFKLKGIGFLSNKDLLSAEEIIVEQISSRLMDFYTNITEDENGSEMKIFVRYGYDIYLTQEKNPNEYKALTGVLNNFLKIYLPTYYENRVNDTEKRIEKLTDETKALQEEITDDATKISKLKKEIEELEGKLNSNNELLETSNNKLKKRSEKLDRIRIQLRKL